MVNNELVKKTVYDKLFANVNNIDTSGFVLKAKYDTDKPDLVKKICDADKTKFLIPVELLKKHYNAKITEIESKAPSITGLGTNAALTAVENKIPDLNNLVKKKKDRDAKILDTESKYFTTADYNNFTSQTLDAKIKQKGLVDKSAVNGFISNSDIDRKSSNISNKS